MKTLGAAVSAAFLLSLAAPAAAEPAAADPAAPFAAGAVASDELSAIRGRDNTAMDIRASNSSNVANNSVIGQSQTGQITLDSSFQGMSGLSLLSANTGNNVSINSSLNVNVAVLPH